MFWFVVLLFFCFVFVTLKTSKANLRRALSPRFKLFAREESIPKTPSPRNLFRIPASPGYGKRIGDPCVTPSLIAESSEKICGRVFLMCLWTLTGAVVTANAWSSQLVVHP